MNRKSTLLLLLFLLLLLLLIFLFLPLLLRCQVKLWTYTASLVTKVSEPTDSSANGLWTVYQYEDSAMTATFSTLIMDNSLMKPKDARSNVSAYVSDAGALAVIGFFLTSGTQV